MKMKEILEKLLLMATDEVKAAKSLKELEDLRVKYLGKKGEVTSVLKNMKDLSNEERPIIGKMANDVREAIENLLDSVKEDKKRIEMDIQLQTEGIDVTMPSKKSLRGHKHPLNVALDEIKEIFLGMGFKIAEGPEIDTVYHNFDALNAPVDHPSRSLSDTFYINEELILRTQTSPIQVRTMKSQKPPIRIIAPGRCFRNDEIDATHSPMFHQIEGLVVDKDITMADLKGTLDMFAKRLFGSQTRTKFRPHYFPFTEPSGEVDVSCFKCGGEGCRFCKGSGWIEILGCGMVHPNVLSECGIDPEVYTGFAFGMGLDRITMLKYEIDDIRILFENDIRLIKQF
jgi:phenylalanyl-tRNA synthetase alpha chain